MSLCPTNDPEAFFICPYDSTHQVRNKKKQIHLSKCRRNHPEMQLKICRFNATHHVKNLREHELNCVDNDRLHTFKTIDYVDEWDNIKNPPSRKDFEFADEWNKEPSADDRNVKILYRKIERNVPYEPIDMRPYNNHLSSPAPSSASSFDTAREPPSHCHSAAISGVGRGGNKSSFGGVFGAQASGSSVESNHVDRYKLAGVGRGQHRQKLVLPDDSSQESSNDRVTRYLTSLNCVAQMEDAVEPKQDVVLTKHQKSNNVETSSQFSGVSSDKKVPLGNEAGLGRGLLGPPFLSTQERNPVGRGLTAPGRGILPSGNKPPAIGRGARLVAASASRKPAVAGRGKPYRSPAPFDYDDLAADYVREDAYHTPEIFEDWDGDYSCNKGLFADYYG